MCLWNTAKRPGKTSITFGWGGEGGLTIQLASFIMLYAKKKKTYKCKDYKWL